MLDGYEYIINDADFKKIKHLSLSVETMEQFHDDVVCKHPNKRILLANFSDIFVLVARHDSHNYLKDGEKSWEQIMNKKQYDILKKNKKLVIAYMLVSESENNKEIHYIELFDTIIRNNNLGRYMIYKYEYKYEYEYEYNVTLVPQNILPSSAKYWAKEFGLWLEDSDTGKFGMYKQNIDEYIKDLELDSDDLYWEPLYDLCDNNDENLKKFELAAF